jgi:uridine kinase
VSSGRPLVIGLAGGTGSGKTTVARSLARTAGDGRAVIVPQDAYYRAQGDVPMEIRARTNYDEPGAFDHELLVEQVDALRAGETILRPVYDFERDDRADETVRVASAAVVIIEGILVLHDADLRERLTLKVFVDAPADERFIRRLERDVRERGRSATSVIDQYRRTVKPMHDLFVEPSKAHADLILPGGGQNRVALEVLQAFVSFHLEGRRVVDGEGAPA